MNRALPLFKGTLDLLILKALSVEPMHGYGLALWMERGSDGEIVVEDSAIYQALRRLEGRRLVEAEWGQTSNNRRARFYRLTSGGRRRLREEAQTWIRYVRWVGTLLEAGDGLPADGSPAPS
jgi:transcriptional regulator